MEMLFSSAYCILAIIAVPLGIYLGYWYFEGRHKAEANALKNKFFQLGNLRGMPRNKIEQTVGKPNSWSSIGQNKVICTWQTLKYHITLIFENDICQGVQSEISV
jgi:hypothetical protein